MTVKLALTFGYYAFLAVVGAMYTAYAIDGTEAWVPWGLFGLVCLFGGISGWTRLWSKL